MCFVHFSSFCLLHNFKHMTLIFSNMLHPPISKTLYESSRIYGQGNGNDAFGPPCHRVYYIIFILRVSKHAFKSNVGRLSEDKIWQTTAIVTQDTKFGKLQLLLPKTKFGKLQLLLPKTQITKIIHSKYNKYSLLL
jgi:hypothetical protein